MTHGNCFDVGASVVRVLLEVVFSKRLRFVVMTKRVSIGCVQGVSGSANFMAKTCESAIQDVAPFSNRADNIMAMVNRL
jgi:hypothetical protein